ncbi:MAG: hypothetical protein GF363_01240 [Chitinivibrionales bacterium]|nr:hypothetical protein [Chitinivibrionales bacterium]
MFTYPYVYADSIAVPRVSIFLDCSSTADTSTPRGGISDIRYFCVHRLRKNGENRRIKPTNLNVRHAML